MSCRPHGGAPPFRQKLTCLPQLTLGPYVVHICPRYPRVSEATKSANSAVRGVGPDVVRFRGVRKESARLRERSREAEKALERSRMLWNSLERGRCTGVLRALGAAPPSRATVGVGD